MRQLAILLAPCLLASFSSQAADCHAESQRAKTALGSALILRDRDCQGADRSVTLLLEGKEGSAARALRLWSRSGEAALHGARFLDLERDGSPEVEVSGPCGAGPNCAREIYKLSEREDRLFRYYKGGYANVRMTKSYLVTSSRGSCCSWEYLAYRLPPPDRAVGEFAYSISIGSIDASDRPSCKIQRLRSKALELVRSPPSELLVFCKHYGVPYELVGSSKKPRKSRGSAP